MTNFIYKSEKYNNPIFIFGFILICSILLGIMFALTPLECDDIVFAKNFRDMLADGLQFDEYIDYFKLKWLTHNGRFGDKLMPFLIFIPKWTYALITTGLMIIMFHLSIKLSNFNSVNSSIFGSILLIGLMTLFLPWSNYMFTVAYSFNYIWEVAFAMIVLYFFFNPTKIRGGGGIFIMILCLFTSASHELFSLAIGLGMLLYLIMNYKTVNRFQFLIFVLWGLGGLFILLSPGFRGRFYNVGNIASSNLPFFDYLFSHIDTLALIIPFIAATVISLPFKSFRMQLNRQRLSFILFNLVVVLVTLIVARKSFMEPRVFFVGDFFAGIGLIYIFKVWEISFKPIISKIISAAFIGFVIVHLCTAIHWQNKVYCQYNKIVDLWQKSEDGTIYYDLILNKDIPWLALSKPNGISFQTQFYRIEFYLYYKTHNQISILPTDLSDLKTENAKLISESPNIRIYKNNIISSKPLYNFFLNRDIQNTLLNIKFTDGSEISGISGFYQEIRQQSEQILYYWYPDYPSKDYYQKEIADIDAITI